MHLVQRLEYVSQQTMVALNKLSTIQEIIDGKWDGVPPEKIIQLIKDPRLGPGEGVKRLQKARAVLVGTALPPMGKRHQIDYDADVVEVEDGSV